MLCVFLGRLGVGQSGIPPRHQASINSDQTDPFPLFTDRQCICVQMFIGSTGATLTNSINEFLTISNLIRFKIDFTHPQISDSIWFSFMGKRSKLSYYLLQLLVCSGTNSIPVFAGFYLPLNPSRISEKKTGKIRTESDRSDSSRGHLQWCLPWKPPCLEKCMPGMCFARHKLFRFGSWGILHPSSDFQLVHVSILRGVS